MGAKSTIYIDRESALRRIGSCFKRLDDEGVARILGVLEDEMSRMGGYGDESSYNYQIVDDEDAEDFDFCEDE